MPISALNCLSVLNIRSLAGDLWFARGEAYLRQGRVYDLTADGRRLVGKVTGTQTYRVRLSCRNSRIEFSCTCPVGEDGNFCKHCVAVALAWVEGESTRREPKQDASEHNSNVRSFLEAQDHQKLIDLILQEASRNRRLRDRLEIETARAQPSGPDVTVLKKQLLQRRVQRASTITQCRVSLAGSVR